jgi:hypothetical protein
MNKTNSGLNSAASLAKAKEILENFSKHAGENIAAELRKELESCPMEGGGYQRGGDRRATIKRLVYLVIALGGANALASATAANTIAPGLLMMFNGECSMLGNVAWRLISWENPVCASYNNMLSTFARAFAGSPEAIALLTGGITATGAGVYAIDALVDRIVNAIEAAMDRMLGTATKALPNPRNESGNRNRNGNGGDPGVALGGRRKTRSRKHKKGKHTRRH